MTKKKASIEFDYSLQSKKETLRLLLTYQQAVDLNLICSITDYDGKIIYVNQKFCEVSGYSEEELIGQNHNIVNAGFHTKEYFQNMWGTIKSGKIWQGEIKCKRKDGKYFWLQSAILPVFDANGKIIHFFSLRFSIDEIKAAEEEKIERIKQIEEILFMTSHRVRQPVANILGLSNIIEDADLSIEELRKIVGFMKQSAIALDTFTHELTEFIYEADLKEKST